MGNFEMILTTVLPLGTLILGWLLGLSSSMVLERIRHKNILQAKIFDQYLKVREEIVGAISGLMSSLRESDDQIDYSIIEEYTQKVTELYYRHYDFLPEDVLFEIICLYSCLAKKGKNIYRCDPRSRVVQLDLNNDAALSGFLEKLSLVKNLRYYYSQAIKSRNEIRRTKAIIQLQCFKVGAVLNSFFRVPELMSWGKYLRKFDRKNSKSP